MDNEIQRILVEARARVRKLIETKKPLLSKIAKILSEREVIESKEFEEIIEAYENPGAVVKPGTDHPKGVDFAPPPLVEGGGNTDLPKPTDLI